MRVFSREDEHRALSGETAARHLEGVLAYGPALGEVPAGKPVEPVLFRAAEDENGMVLEIVFLPYISVCRKIEPVVLCQHVSGRHVLVMNVIPVRQYNDRFLVAEKAGEGGGSFRVGEYPEVLVVRVEFD